MKALLQRVTHAEVIVEQQSIAKISQGLLILLGVEKADDETAILRMSDRILHYRMFSDEQGKMNLDVQNVEGEILLVPQFTLAADTKKGRRASFSSCKPPEEGLQMFQHLVDTIRQSYPKVVTGQFGADMQVNLCNNGPVTFILEA